MFYLGWAVYALHVRSIAEKFGHAEILNRVVLPQKIIDWLGNLLPAAEPDLTLQQLLMVVLGSPRVLEKDLDPDTAAVALALNGQRAFGNGNQSRNALRNNRATDKA